MELTQAQEKALTALKESVNEWDNWQTLGLTGRSQPALVALVKNGLVERHPDKAVYRIKH